MTDLALWYDWITGVAAFWYDLITGVAILVLSLIGIALRIRRIRRNGRIVLPEPADPADVAYLRTIKKSTSLRLFVKVVFLVGGLIMVFDLPLFMLWRAMIIGALAAMIMETASVDYVRDRLGSGSFDSRRQAQVDRMEATGRDTNRMMREQEDRES